MSHFSFSPPFSPFKVKAINAMKMANYAKVNLAFPQNFWGRGEEILMGIIKKNGLMYALNLDHPKYFPGFVNNISTFIYVFRYGPY